MTAPSRTRQRVGLVVLGVVLLIAIGIAIDRATVSDEEALDQLWTDLVDAMAREDVAAIDGLFHGTLTYRGPRPMGNGDRGRALSALSDYFAQTSQTKITSKREIPVEGNVGVIKASGHVRFDWGDGLVLYKMTTEVTCVRAGDGWQVQTIATSELAPGLF